MKTISKKMGLLSILFLLVLSIAIVSFASSYSSTLSIPGNSTLNGSGRDYDAGTMKISINFDWLDVPTSSNPMYVTLQKKNLLFYEGVESTLKNYPANSTVTSNFSYKASGNYRFYFDTLGFYTSGGYASYVQMGNF